MHTKAHRSLDHRHSVVLPRQLFPRLRPRTAERFVRSSTSTYHLQSSIFIVSKTTQHKVLTHHEDASSVACDHDMAKKLPIDRRPGAGASDSPPLTSIFRSDYGRSTLFSRLC